MTQWKCNIQQHENKANALEQTPSWSVISSFYASVNMKLHPLLHSTGNIDMQVNLLLLFAYLQHKQLHTLMHNQHLKYGTLDVNMTLCIMFCL